MRPGIVKRDVLAACFGRVLEGCNKIFLIAALSLTQQDAHTPYGRVCHGGSRCLLAHVEPQGLSSL